MVKRLKRAGRKIDEKKCYIEELPDELLGDIVSRLKTNVAAGVCRVSRRWRNVSRLVLSTSRNLDFDFTAKKHRKHKCTEFARCTLIVGMAKHKEPLVDHLRLALDDHHNHIDLLDLWPHSTFMDWLQFANVKRVQSLDMDIKARILLQSPDTFSFEHRIITMAGKLPFVEKPWDRLTTLSLKSVLMYDETVDKLLPSSPNLETLLLQNIPCTKLEVKDTNPKLKRLEILDCALLERVHIVSAPKLESLKLIPWMDKYYESFKRNPFKKKKTYRPNYLYLELISTNIAPKLEAIYLGGPLCRNLVLDAHQLKKLHLNMDLECDHVGCWIDFPTFPTLGNLKQLELTFTSTQRMDHDKGKLHTITCIINSCPLLEKLTLKYEIQKVDMDDEDCYSDSYHTNEFLQEVEIVGWSGLKSEIDLVLHLIRTSPKLQRLSFDPTPPQMSGFRVFPPVIRAEHELQSAALVGQLIGCLHNKIVK